MTTSVFLKLVCVVVASLACMVMTKSHVEAAVTCNVVVSDLSACITYLKSGRAVPPTCCSGVKSFKAAANTTTPGHQTACQCHEQLANSIPVLNTGATSTLPGKPQVCVSVGYPINATVNCSK